LQSLTQPKNKKEENKIVKAGITLNIGRRSLFAILTIIVLVAGIFVLFNLSEIDEIINPTPVNRGATIIMKEEVREALNVLWAAHASEKNEFVTCLDGRVQDGNIAIITSLSGTRVISSNQTQIIFMECKGSFSKLHSHPGNSVCRLSDTDKNTLDMSGHDFEGVICGLDTFAFFHKNKKDEPLQLVLE